jgi:hypothetical protein
MEIKINLDQIFENTQELNTTQETPSSQMEPSFQSLSDSFDYQLTLDPRLFQPFSHHEPLLPESLDPSEDEHISYVSKERRSEVESNSVKSPQPGERLFYESQASYMRKMYLRDYSVNSENAASSSVRQN